MKSTLLIVEDDHDLAANLAAILEHFNFTVVIAQDGVEGLDLALSEKPAIIFSDYQMPRMNGVQLALEIQSRPDISKTPFVLMTGAADFLPASAEKLLVLQKPLELKTILHAVGNKIYGHA